MFRSTGRFGSAKPQLGYAVAVGGAALAAGVRLLLNRLWGSDVPLLLFVVPVLFAAGLGGLRPGLLAAFLGGAAGMFLFFPPGEAWSLGEGEKLFWLGAFVVIGALISFTCESLHRHVHEAVTARADASEIHGQLQRQVQARTYMEDRWMQLLRANVIGIGVGDYDGRVIDANDVLLQMLGFTRAEFERGDVDWAALTPPEHAAVTAAARRTCRSEGVSPTYEKEFLTREGTRVPVLIRMVQAPDDSRHVIAYVVDLSRQRNAEGALRANAARLALLVNSARDYAIITLDTGGRITSWNAGAERINGYTSDEAVGQHIALLYPEPDRGSRPTGELDQALREGRLEVEGWRVRKGGGRYWANVSVTPIVDEDGTLLGFAKITRDLTERRHSEVLLHSVLDNVIDAIIVIDQTGMVQSFNKAAERMFQYAESEVRGRNVSVLMPEPDHSAHDGYLRNYLATGVARIIGIGRQVTALRRDGSRFPADLSVSEFRIDGQLYFTGVIRDVTAQRRLEEQLRQSQKMEAVGRLAGGVAHDFNNLLTVILGCSAFLREESAPGSEAGEMLAAITDAGEHASRLTRQLLVFSRQAVLEPQVVDLNTVVLETKKMLSRVIGEDVVLHSALNPATPQVLADPGQVSQVLVNLAVNARDAMPRGGRLTLETAPVVLDDRRARAIGDVASGAYALLSVSDSGTGMTEEVRARAFEPFYTTKMPGMGTGLGLSTVYGIVKQSGGHVELYSEVGVGTAFKIYLPAVDPAARRLPPEERSTPRGGTEVVLLVEDEQRVRDVARLALGSYGYEILAAGGGAEALEILEARRGQVDLLVTDVVMPGMSGRELAETCLARYPGLRVLYVSGYTDDAVVRHGLLHQEIAFLQKPYTPESLAARVRQVLDGEAGSGAGTPRT